MQSENITFHPDRGIHFSTHEILNYAIGITALTGMYFISYAWPVYVAFAIGAVGLILHELGHKTVAWLENAPSPHFILTPIGITIGFIAAIFFGIPFTVVGGVAISDSVGDKARVYIAAAGPLTNFLEFIVFTVLHFTFPIVLSIPSIGGTVPLWEAMAFMNLYLSVFNFIPFPGFDGFHVFQRAPWLWVGIFSTIVGTALVVIFGTNTLTLVLPLFQVSRGGLLGMVLAGNIPIFSNILVTGRTAIELPNWVAYTGSK